MGEEAANISTIAEQQRNRGFRMQFFSFEGMVFAAAIPLAEQLITGKVESDNLSLTLGTLSYYFYLKSQFILKKAGAFNSLAMSATRNRAVVTNLETKFQDLFNKIDKMLKKRS